MLPFRLTLFAIGLVLFAGLGSSCWGQRLPFPPIPCVLTMLPDPGGAPVTELQIFYFMEKLISPEGGSCGCTITNGEVHGATFTFYLVFSNGSRDIAQLTVQPTPGVTNFEAVLQLSCGAVTNQFSWAQYSAPTIVTNPADLEVIAGSTASFSVTASYANSFQWQKDNIDLADDGRITGSTTATLQIANATSADVGAYDVVVSNDYGTNSSATANLTVRRGLRLQGEITAGGIFRLLITNSDGSDYDPAFLPSLEVYAATTLSLDPADWVKLNEPLLLANGKVQLEDTQSPSNPFRFYKAVEKP